MQKEAIAVYNPSDPWERAIQDASKSITGDWLPSHPCQLLAQVVGILKYESNWIAQEDLLPIRASYLFSPIFNNDKQERVFVTDLLFLRDIMENHEINESLHEPIAFMTTSLAYFLFREHSIHVYMNENLLRSANPHTEFIDVGGFLIVQNGNIKLCDGVITDVRYYGKQNKQDISDLINEIKDQSGLRFVKMGAREIGLDIYHIDEHTRALKPGMVVWDKITRSKGRIIEIEPGENGIIKVFLNAINESVSQDYFDQRFTVIKQ